MKRTDMTLEIGYPNGPHPIYGEDNLPDPWSNPTIKLIQNAFNPVAVIDIGLLGRQQDVERRAVPGRRPRPSSRRDAPRGS